MRLVWRAVLARLALATVAASVLAGCGAGEVPLPPVAPAAISVGEPQSCVRLSQVRETRVRDELTIDFIGNSGRVWRNTLTSRCFGLKASNAFSYNASLGQLCSVDLIYVLERAGDLRRGPACQLGQFVPVTLRE